MNITVTTHAQASETPVQTISGASRWEVDGNGYLNVWSRNPDRVIVTFAPGWISVRQEGTS